MLELLSDRKVRGGLSLALALAGFIVYIAYSSVEAFPDEIFSLVGLVLFVIGLTLHRQTREDPEVRAMRDKMKLKGSEIIAALVVFYFGIIVSRQWSEESVDFLWRYLPYIIVPAFAYLIIASVRQENKIREMRFGVEPEEAAASRLTKEAERPAKPSKNGRKKNV